MTLPRDVFDTLIACSLRFDGYKWLEARHPGADANFRQYVDPIVDTLRLHADQEANFAACFALQRFLCKWGGEMLPPEGRHHAAWRYLFLHLYSQEVPAEFRAPESFHHWERDHAAKAHPHAAIVRETLLLNHIGEKMLGEKDPFKEPGHCRIFDLDWIETASWSLACELVRGAPNRLRLIQSHNHSNFCNSLTVLDGSRAVSDLNRKGSLHVLGRLDDGLFEPVSLDVWAFLWFGENPRSMLEKWRQHLGMIVSEPLPAGSPVSLTYRVIAAFLKQAAFGATSWRCVNGFDDRSGGRGVLEEHFARFPGAEARLRVAMDDDYCQQPAYRFWFLEREREPVACFETNGTVWLLDGSARDLNAEYRRRRNVNALAALLIAV